MISRLESIYNKIEDNRYYRKFSFAAFLLLIILMSFQGAFRGLDVTDSTYSLTNFKYMDRLDGMWFFSTFYANLLGGFFMLLPGGTTLLGLKLYTSAVKCLLAVAAFLFFDKAVDKGILIKFFGVIASVGLCWCPETIMYNYLTYLFFFVGAISLYTGLEKDNKKYLILAGFVLGSNVFVRLPNVIEAGLIVVLWYDSFLKKDKFKEVVNKTLLCILGYIIAFVPAIIAIISTRGIGEYINGITEMISMSSTAQGYSLTDMIRMIILSFWFVRSMIGLVILVMAVTTVLWLFLRKKAEFAGVILSLFATALMVLVLYKNGMFTKSYNAYSAFWGLGKVLLFVIYLYLFIVLFRKDRALKDKRLALMAITIALITPLGTNNELYATLNNMFFMLPLIWHFSIRDIFDKKKYFCVGIEMAGLLFVLMYQSVLFGTTYSFRDGVDTAMDTVSYGNEVTDGVYTTAENAARIAELSAFWKDNHLNEGEVMLYGDVSGMSFILDTPLAISTAWPSLESFADDKFVSDIDKLYVDNKKPAVLVDNSTYYKFFDENLTGKQGILKQFLEINKYTIAYQNDRYTVYIP